MSSNYSANQYESSFRSMRSCCESRPFKQRPDGNTGHTKFIVNDNGHLLPGVTKRGNAWPAFKGTWDLPARIPVHHINPTGRSAAGLNRLRSWGLDPKHTGTSGPHTRKERSQTLQDRDEQDHATQTSTVRAHPAPHSRNGVEPTADQRPDAQATVVQSVAPSDKDEQTARAPEKEGSSGRGSAAEEKCGGGLESGPQTGRVGSAAPSISKKTRG